ncbi:hypothetical protein [Paenibacillus sp. Z6-24]
MGLIKSILNQVLKSKSGSSHRRHRSYSSSDRSHSRRGHSHNQYGHGHYKRKRGSSSYSSS